MKLLFTSIFLFFSIFLFSQRLHLPDDIARIIQNSSLEYQIDSTGYQGNPIPFPQKGQASKKWKQININGDIQLVLTAKNHTKKIKKSIKIGDKRFNKKKYKKARECYQKAYKKINTSPLVINKIAATYAAEKDYETASFWYERSLEYNPIDTETLLGMAQAFEQLGNIKKAKDAILLAHIYNINNQEITKKMMHILALNNISYKPIRLSPVFDIQKEKNRIFIRSNHPIWGQYAAVKAIWKYEPNYARKMNTLSQQKSSTIEEKEAILNALIVYNFLEDKDKKNKFPLLELLSKISFQEQINNFIFYEIEARKNPTLPLLLPPQKITALKKYITDFRSKL